VATGPTCFRGKSKKETTGSPAKLPVVSESDNVVDDSTSNQRGQQAHREEPVDFPLVKMRRDGDTQPRQATDEATVADYAARMADGDHFPPVVCFFDGRSHWLADGFTRAAAAEKAGRTHLGAIIRHGSARDAFLYAVHANGRQGVPLSRADKRAAVARLLEDAEWSKLSDREIARRCAVSQPFVSKLRREGRTPPGDNVIAPKAPPQTPRIEQRDCDAMLGVAAALAEIRDDRLYRGTHSDFYAYCSDEWGLDRESIDIGFDVLGRFERSIVKQTVAGEEVLAK
jgi:hypothetical protein